MILFFWLVVGHCVCDYPLQGDFLARAKNHRNPIPGVPWWVALWAHALMHAGAVAYITGSYGLALLELGLHCGIDWLKSEASAHHLTPLGQSRAFVYDQAAHVACKVAFVAVVMLGRV